MKKLTTLLLAVLLSGQLLMAQTVAEARKSLYNGRVTSATQALEKIVGGNSKNAEAIYWLGQAYLASDSGGVDKARQVYQNALNNGVNDPLVWVGMGHVELLAGNKDGARQRFEAAITNSISKKKENPTVLNAIGRANADAPAGDPAYAVEKLKRAAELDPNNADIFINLGVNYLKMGPDQGGNAYEAYTNALKADPNSALAKFRLGKIFQSQGNTERFLQYYNDAVTGDPTFAPAYIELYDYYSNRDVNKAREYIEKYIANSDKDCRTDYFYADYLFRSGKYQESLDRAKAMSTGACANYPRLKVLYAYNYDRLGDSTQARANIESFLNTADPTRIQGSDYLFGASILKKSAGGEQTAINYLQKALTNDTVRANRMQYMDTIASLYRKLGNNPERLNWLQQSFQLNPNPSNLDLYNMADAAINAGNFALGDSMARAYVQKYPDQEYGYVLLSRAAKAADPDSTKGTAFDETQQYIDFLKSQDSVKNANKIKYQYYYIASVAADKLKDYPKALDAINSILVIDPNDTFGKQAKPVLEKAVNGKSSSAGAAPKKAAGATPKKKG